MCRAISNVHRDQIPRRVAWLETFCFSPLDTSARVRIPLWRALRNESCNIEDAGNSIGRCGRWVLRFKPRPTRVRHTSTSRLVSSRLASLLLYAFTYSHTRMHGLRKDRLPRKYNYREIPNWLFASINTINIRFYKFLAQLLIHKVLFRCRINFTICIFCFSLVFTFFM